MTEMRIQKYVVLVPVLVKISLHINHQENLLFKDNFIRVELNRKESEFFISKLQFGQDRHLPNVNELQTRCQALSTF